MKYVILPNFKDFIYTFCTISEVFLKICFFFNDSCYTEFEQSVAHVVIRVFLDILAESSQVMKDQPKDQPKESRGSV